MNVHSPVAADEAVLLRAYRGCVAELTLNRPQARNALSEALLDALNAELDRLAADRTVRAVIVTGAPTIFSAGHDLKEMRAHWGDADRGRAVDRGRPRPARVHRPAAQA